MAAPGRVVGAFALACSLSPLPAIAADARSLVAERAEVRLALAGDGSVMVTETTAIRFSGGPFTSFTRRLSTKDTDGITDIAAAVDGVPSPAGRQPGNIRIERENGLSVTWRLEPVSDTSRTLTLSYRVRGATRRENGADVLSWRLLSSRRSYQVETAVVRVTWPDAGILAAVPRVSNGVARVSDDGHAATIEANRELPPGVELEFTLAFVTGGVASQMAAWQARQERGQAAAPGLAAGAGAILLSGFVWMVVFLIGHRRESVTGLTLGARATPPDHLSVALAAAALEPGGGTNWSHALATLVDLAGRGVLRVEEQLGRTWQGTREYLIHLADRPSGLRPHEAGLLDLLFVSKSGSVATVKLSAAGRAAQAHLNVFKRPVSDELVAVGLVSPDRVRTRAALVRWGVLLVVVAATGFVVAASLVTTYGGWPMLVPGAVLTVALMILVLASLFSVIATAGLVQLAPWRSFLTFIRDVAKGRLPIADSAWFASYLPYAVARNLGRDWVRTFEKAGRATTPPAWYTPASGPPGRRTALDGFADMLATARAAGVQKHAH